MDRRNEWPLTAALAATLLVAASISVAACSDEESAEGPRTTLTPQGGSAGHGTTSSTEAGGAGASSTGGGGAGAGTPTGDTRILYLDVTSAPVGAFVGIYGRGFGASQGSSRVMFGAVEAASYVSWGPAARGAAPDEIIVTVPAGAGSGIVVDTASGSSGSVPFAVHPGRQLWVSPSGDDGNDCLSELTACATLPVGKAAMQAGDVLLVREGTYTGCDGSCPNPTLYIRPSDPTGTETEPITFRGYPGEEVTIDANAVGQTAVYSHASHVAFVNLRVTGKNGLNVAEGVGARIANCEALHANRCGTANGCGGNDWTDWTSAGSGFHASTESEDARFVGNDIHDNGIERRDHGLYIYGQNMRVAYNRIWSNFGYGVHGYKSGGPEFSGMQVYGNLVWSNGPPGQVQSGTAGILCHESCQQARIFNNVVWQNYSYGISVGSSAAEVRVYNNTLLDDDSYEILVSDTTTDVTVKNNILLDDQGESQLLRVEAAGIVTADHNLYFPDGPQAFQWAGSAFDFAGYRASSSQGASSLVADPLLADPGAADVHLGVTSPAIDAGTGDIAPGLTAPATDFEADPRPAGAAVDIGADEAP